MRQNVTLNLVRSNEPVRAVHPLPTHPQLVALLAADPGMMS